MAYSDTGAGRVRSRRGPRATPADPDAARIERAAAALGLPVHAGSRAHTFPDLYTPLWVASLVLLVVLVVLYNARTRALHRHAAYLDMWEWLLWTGITPVRAAPRRGRASTST